MPPKLPEKEDPMGDPFDITSPVADMMIFSAIYDNLYGSRILRAISTMRKLHVEHAEC